MKVLMRPVEMIAWFTKDGKPNPLRYQMSTDENENVTVRVDKIITRDEEKLAGNRMLIYKCRSVLNGVEKVYELKYEISTCKWFLYKM